MTKMTPYEQQQLKYNEVMNYINENFTKLQLGISGSEKIKESRHSVGDS